MSEKAQLRIEVALIVIGLCACCLMAYLLAGS